MQATEHMEGGIGACPIVISEIRMYACEPMYESVLPEGSLSGLTCTVDPDSFIPPVRFVLRHYAATVL